MIEDVIAYLDQHADELDGWAEQSRRGGWSTHQVDANRSAANECRRQASALRRLNLEVTKARALVEQMKHANSDLLIRVQQLERERVLKPKRA